MLRLLAVLLLLTSLGSACHAQIKTEVIERLALLGVTSPVIQGNRILVGADSNVAVSPVVILKLETSHKFKRVKAQKNGQRVQPETLADNEYLFAGVGRWVVEVTVFDPELGIDDATVEFEIDAAPGPSPGPDPEPGPGPTPPPDPPAGPFDNLAQRVAVIARAMLEAERSAYNAAMKEVVARMQSLQIRRIEEAVAFVASKKLKGEKLNALLDADAEARGSMSFGDAVRWYQEVEKGTR
jgi:hypothetical protein